MEVAVGVSHIALVPMAAVPALQGISGIIKSIRPEYRLEKWAIRIEQIVAAVTAKSDRIPSEVMSHFLVFVERYIKARCQYEEQARRGKERWFKFWNKGAKNAHSAHARQAWNQGMQISMHADIMHQKCMLDHKNYRNPEGRCLQCFPDNYIANRYGTQIPETETPLTWEFLLKSALNLATNTTDGVTDGNNVIPKATTAPIPQTGQPGPSHRPPSYQPPIQSTSASAGQNCDPTTDTKTLSNDDVPELSIPLDEEERQILGAVIGEGRSSLIEAGYGEEVPLQPKERGETFQCTHELAQEANESYNAIELVPMTVDLEHL